MKVIITAKENIASMNMFKVFTEELGFEKTDKEFDNNPVFTKDDFVLVTTNSNVIPIEHVCEFPDFKENPPEIYIVASSHKSTAAMKTLSCHYPGNWQKAEMGGNPKELCLGNAYFLRNMLKELKKYSDERYEKCYEVTHHGPSDMNAPTMFVEVGGSEEEWNDMEAIRFACKCMLTANDEGDVPVAVGFGGPHYAPVFSKDEYVENLAVAHILPKYAIEGIEEEAVLQAFEKTVPKTRLAVMEWKGLSGADKEFLKNVFEKNGIEWKKLKDFKTE
jgi:D-aminoacyl-tRNA deacylase